MAISSSLWQTINKRPAIRPAVYARTEERLVNTLNEAGKGRNMAMSRRVQFRALGTHAL